MYKKYKDNNRNGSQSEKSTFAINNDIFKMSGYHNYEYNKNLIFPIIITNVKQLNQLSLIDKINFNENSTLLDMGCGNGAISIYMFFKYNFNKVILFDHDEEYIANINELIKYDEKLNTKIETINGEFGNLTEKYDYVLVLSLIHWLYSATANYGCLFKIIKKIKENVKKCLIIEWIDNTDPAIKILNHINFNKDIHITEYNKINFLKALNENFDKVIFLGNSTETREIYCCELYP